LQRKLRLSHFAKRMPVNNLRTGTGSAVSPKIP